MREIDFAKYSLNFGKINLSIGILNLGFWLIKVRVLEYYLARSQFIENSCKGWKCDANISPSNFDLSGTNFKREKLPLNVEYVGTVVLQSDLAS